jgi:long-chain acyl-CoA synthetase
MRHKHLGVWQPYTWKDYYVSAKHLALGLLSLGMAPGDRVLIIGDNAPQWYMAMLAVQANRGVAVGLFADLPPEEIEFIARNAGAKFAVVEGQEQVDKFLQIVEALPAVQKLVNWTYKGLAKVAGNRLIGWRETLKLGESYESSHPGAFERRIEAGRPDDVCAIVYTAGTTGPRPKGALHSHRTLRAGAEFLLALDPWTEADNVVPYLPPVWIEEHWIGIGCHLLSGATLNFAEAPETQQRDSRDTGPSIVFNRARIWESQARAVQAGILGADALKRWAYRRLMPIGYRAAEARYRKQPAGLRRKLQVALAESLLLRAMRRSLGLQNARICYSSGGILSPEALKFYHALNLPLKNLYGTAEGGLLAGARSGEIDYETVGSPRPDAELRIGPGSELIYRQPGTFLGYHGDPAQTAQALQDGWFHSGDAGVRRDDGQLVVLGRVDDLVPLPGGQAYSPQWTESRLRFSPFIRDAWVFNAGDPAAPPAALIVINAESVGRWAGQRKVAFSSFAELSQSPEVYGLIRQEFDRINRGLPAGARVRRFVNLNREFDPNESETTRTRNLKRAVLFERFRSLVDACSVGRTDTEVETRLRHRDGRMETASAVLAIASTDAGGEGADG